MRDPAFKKRVLAEQPAPALGMLVWQFDKLFALGDPPDYEPSAEQSMAAQAARQGVAPEAWVYDRLLDDDGHALLYRPFLNYSHGSLDAVREMLLHDYTVPGLGDAGAHCGLICDGSFPTYLLSHWGRSRTRGERIPIETLVKAQTADTAALVGLSDRGRIAPGMKADLNLIDFAALGMRPPEIVHDLPAGGKRLIQRASGYVATVCSGAVTFRNGESTGALPGQLVRGPQSGDGV
jgi:N-acyl-D-aspartate/D-glutamate deacylase